MRMMTMMTMMRWANGRWDDDDDDDDDDDADDGSNNETYNNGLSSEYPLTEIISYRPPCG